MYRTLFLQTAAEHKPYLQCTNLMSVFRASALTIAAVLTCVPAGDVALASTPAMAAAQVAIDAMRQRGLTAALVVQDVRTGSIVVSAASHPDRLDATTRVLPLSFMKVFLAASWWNHRMPERTFDCVQRNASGAPRTRKISLDEMLVNGCDLPGKQAAIALRRAIGGPTIVAELARFVGSTTGNTIRADMNDDEWGDVWSLGETHIMLTLRQLTDFLRATASERQLVRASTSTRLNAAFLDAVRRGTAKGSDAALAGTGWTIGGKTGSGPLRPGEELDGLFAGLIFDSTNRARFAVATFVRRGGYGGGHAARLSAEVARELATAAAAE
jgi:hypothetical protein